MVSFTIRMKFAPEDREEVAGILRRLTEASRQEPACVNFIPHSVEDDADTIMIYEQYTDPEGENAHRQSAHYKEFAVGGLFQKMLERSRENLNAYC